MIALSANPSTTTMLPETNWSELDLWADSKILGNVGHAAAVSYSGALTVGVRAIIFSAGLYNELCLKSSHMHKSLQHLVIYLAPKLDTQIGASAYENLSQYHFDL